MLIEEEIGLVGTDAKLRSRHLNKRQRKIRGIIGIVVFGVLLLAVFSGRKVYKPFD